MFTLNDTVYGNEEKGRKPNKTFIKEINNYPGLLNIMLSIENLVCGRSSHASGVIMYDNNIFDTSAIMKTPSGDIVTQFDLADAEKAGDTKYDFLLTEITDKLIQCINLLQKDKLIEPNLNLKEVYDKYLHPEVMDLSKQELWDALSEGNVLDVFQFNTGVGLAIAKKLKPQNIYEMGASSAMMRLMSERGKESQQDRYYRIKKEGLDVFTQEMKNNWLPDNMIKALHKHCDKYYGCVPMQEQMMEILMDKNIANFTLGEANAARKIVAKKKMDQIPVLKRQVYEHIPNEDYADYIWELAVAPSLGYAFSLNHTLPYSFVGVQTLMLATQFNPIYWNTACLIVNSGAVDPDKKASTDYSKIAKAIGDITSSGIKVSLPNINKSDFGFIPDAKNNEILYGLKAVNNVGDDLIKDIIANRPYKDFNDFMSKVNINKSATLALIKGGAFDEFEDRKKLLVKYIYKTSDLKTRLTLQNFPMLDKNNLIPDELLFERKVFHFNKYLKAINKGKDKYWLDNRAADFYLNNFDIPAEMETNGYYLNIKTWDKMYSKVMDKVRSWMAENKNEILKELNAKLFYENWNKYIKKANLSNWEMDALCFYHHEHELAHLNKSKYGLSDFYELNEEPDVEYTFKRKEAIIPIYKIHKIAGTCIAKDKTKSTVSLLTTEGVVNVKFRKEYFALFDKQISEIQPDGKKKVLEKSWFGRGNMIIVQGIRRGDDFIVKKYNSTPGHHLYKITDIDENGDIIIQEERMKGALEDEE